MIRPSCTREEKIRKKNEKVVDFTSRPRQHGVEFAAQVY